MPQTEDERIAQILSQFPPDINRLTKALQGFIKTNAPDLREEGKIGLKNITYKKKGVVCAITPYQHYISLHFYKGTLMDDPFSLLEGSGGKLRHITFHDLSSIVPDQLLPYLRQAIELDD